MSIKLREIAILTSEPSTLLTQLKLIFHSLSQWQMAKLK
ncbi:hypothetical protein LLB_0312 [Legionella longbeachae D-4968]|nr:hypothetical protein LLB_0312 [Legionella longbeachae D-4968]